MSSWLQLLLWWPATFALAVIAIWGTSIVLGACAVLMFIFAVKWTVTRRRDNRFEREMEENAGE
jgi:Flp pilus assembly protein TadB